MHIQEIILQGFKTYVNRTVISAFDPQFNAITGFNGSGKSNILDGIQFLLGSTNKEMLRLKSNLTELIYKEGCSGIEKASVSIKFRCENKDLRPTGYEASDELLVTRQISKDKVSKFFINGLAANLSKVKALFRSVHLNIENPHFLVKQGQITKIINLKPNELLGMIEETAGTAIYNKTKNESQKMIENKKMKLDSINQILSDSIRPQMDKLKIDKKRYTAFKEKENQLKNLNQEIKTYQFVSKRNLVKKKQYQISHIKDQLASKKSLLQESAQKLTELEGKIKILRNRGNSTLFNDFNKIKSELMQKQSEQKQLKSRIAVVQKDSHAAKEELMLYEEQVERKRQELEWKSKELLNQERQQEEIEALLKEANNSKGESDGVRLLEKQLAQEKEQRREIQIELKSMQSKLQILRADELNDRKTREQIEQVSQNIDKTIEQLDYDISKAQTLQPPKPIDDPELSNNYLQRLQEEKRRILNQNFHLKLSYNDPVPNFDRRTVKGKLFMLFRVKDKVHEKALEVGVGGRLHNIVVENQNVSKLLIEKQTFGKNVSIIPNNKIRFKEIRHETVAESRRIAQEMGGLARPAYQLIQFDESIRNSIMFAFSNFLVCSSPQIAKRIAFHQRADLSYKCVTYEGDIFERGTLTGGHMSANALTLAVYGQLRDVQSKISQERGKFQSEKSAFNEYLEKLNEYKRMKKQIEIKINRRQKFKAKKNQLAFNKKRNFADEIEALTKRIRSLKEELEAHRKKQEEISQKLKKGGKSVDEQKKQIIKEKKQQDRKVEQLKKDCSLLEVQIDGLSKKISQAKTNDSRLQQQILKLENHVRATAKLVAEKQEQFERLEEEKKKIQREQAVSESKLQYLAKQQQVVKNELKKAESDVSALQRELESNETIIEINQKEIKKIAEQCSWLEANREYEINENFDYESSLREFKILTVDVDKLKKTAKMTIDDHSYEKLLEQYNSLLEKRSILQNDKKTLLNNMHELDEKRTKTLQNCYQIVRQNLGKIFNDLLPGATAHLNLIDETDVTKGAELQVQFNKVKKELSELSGGQRSLLALSFILALLLYKPSPFYILDEIDSALDLSHTENIGYMISQRFPQSQFIIISLKEGMFQNANVLYKVHFAEGESKVDRQTLKKK